MSKFYNGDKLLSLKDINKQRPEIFISTSNRSAGKTTFFGKYVVDGFLKHGKKFGLLYRYGYELNEVADKFFSDLRDIFFHTHVMTQKTGEKDTYVELYLSDLTNPETEPVLCGYALALNKADNIKKLSHLLATTDILLFDEFQPESGQYAPNEIQKFHSVHTSLARGGGEQVRYLPVIMISNFVSLLNPYYTAMGISERIQENTNYLRGDGWVLEQGFNETASLLQKESAFNRAFGQSRYLQFSSEKFYLNDNNTFVGKMDGKAIYLLSLRYDGKWFGVRYYNDKMILYVNKTPDLSHRRKIAVSVEDMTEETTLMTRSDPLLIRMRDFFEKGAFRFQNLESKAAIFNLLSY